MMLEMKKESIKELEMPGQDWTPSCQGQRQAEAKGSSVAEPESEFSIES